MNHPAQRPDPSQRSGGSPTVSPFMIPLLFVGIVIGFLAG